MGLDDFMDIDEEANPDYYEDKDDTSGDDSSESSSPEPSYEYDGDGELLDITLDEIEEVLEQTEFDFSEERFPRSGKTFVAESENGNFLMVVNSGVRFDSEEERTHCRDAILVEVADAETQYKTIEPFPVYRVDGWEEGLKDAIQQVKDSKDELVFCDSCGGVMIIRTTNRTKERIRGCSNYPDCRNSEEV